jgi:hypothetical protein
MKQEYCLHWFEAVVLTRRRIFSEMNELCEGDLTVDIDKG